MAYLSSSAARLHKRHCQRRTAAAWATQQHHMARMAMGALWVFGAACLLGAALASVAGGAWVAVLLGIAHV